MTAVTPLFTNTYIYRLWQPEKSGILYM